MNNVPQVTVKVRREWMLDQLMEGTSNHNLKFNWMTLYKKTRHTFEKDLTFVYKKIRLYAAEHKEDLIANHLLRYDRNAEAAFEGGNIQGSNQALQFKEKLLKLHNPEQQVLIQQNTVNVESLDVHQIKELLDKYDKDE